MSGPAAQDVPWVPGPHRLRAALRTARLIDPGGTPAADARASYSRFCSDGIYRHTDLIAGERLLLEAGLLWEEQDVLYPADGMADLAVASDEDGREALMVALLERRPPLWITAVVEDGEVFDELIPDADLAALDKSLDPELREQLLLALGQRFDDEARRRTGELAEAHVLAACRAELKDVGRSDLADQVRQVSKISDALGYDITAPRLDLQTRRLEVKGSRGTEQDLVRVFISRNEAERGLKDEAWSLVACQVADNDSVKIAGWCTGPELVPYLPVDQADEARWASVEIKLPLSLLRDGLPPLQTNP